MAQRWLAGATPGLLPAGSGPGVWAAPSKLCRSHHTQVLQPARKVARAARPGPRMGVSHDLGVTPSRWKGQCIQPPGRRPRPEPGLAWAAPVARGHDLELQATNRRVQVRAEELAELPGGPACLNLRLGLRCAQGWGCGGAPGFPARSRGWREGRKGEARNRKGLARLRLTYLLFLLREGNREAVAQSRGAEGPPGRRALPEGDTWAVGNERILGLASGHRHRGFLPSRGCRADHRSKSHAQAYPCPLRLGPLGKGSSAAVRTQPGPLKSQGALIPAWEAGGG